MGHFLIERAASFDVAVSIGPDIFLATPLSLADVATSALRAHAGMREFVFTSKVNDADGWVRRPRTPLQLSFRSPLLLFVLNLLVIYSGLS